MSPKQEMPTEDTLWTVKDVAHFLQCSVSLVYKKTEAGQMPTLRMGGLVRFDPAAIRTWARDGGKPSATVLPLKR